MSLKTELGPGLSDSTRLYRTLDFFGAASIIKNKNLMFSRADTFQDKNEGVDILLAQLQVAGNTEALGMGWHDSTSAKISHEKVKYSHFISCWTTTEESVAMWSLYSPDYCSVRISTTVGKLRTPIAALSEKYSFARLENKDIDRRVVVATSAKITPVIYDELARITKRVSRRREAMRRIEERYSAKGKKLPKIGEVNPRYFVREEQRRLNVRSSCVLKDKSFEHENEVRLIVGLGEETCTERVLEEQALWDPNHEYHRIAQEFLKYWGFVSTAKLPEREFAPCQQDLVESVAIDPRCPLHKAEFMRNWFELNGINVVDSKCFGYLPSSFQVFPPR
jgi:hypothetical protein